MLNRVLILSVVATVSLSSCVFKEKHEAQELYNRINHINDTLQQYTNNWHSEFDHDSIKKNFNSLATQRVNLGEFISRSRLELSNVPLTPENEKLLADEQALLEVQANKVNDVYPNFELLSELTPKETFEKNMALLANDQTNEQLGINKMNTELLSYAKHYTLKTK